jgi:hypothetical protein
LTRLALQSIRDGHISKTVRFLEQLTITSDP